MPSTSQSRIPRPNSRIWQICDDTAGRSSVGRNSPGRNPLVVATTSKKDEEPNNAAVQIYSSLLLSAWRKRRVEAMRLTKELHNEKERSAETMMQLRCNHLVVSNKQNLNKDLNSELKRALDELNTTQLAVEEMKKAVGDIKAEKAAVEKLLENKNEELDALNFVYMQNRTDLLESLSKQRDIIKELAETETHSLALESEAQKLMREIEELKEAMSDAKEEYAIMLKEKDEQLEQANAEIQKQGEMMKSMEGVGKLLEEYAITEIRLKNDVESLQSELEELKTSALSNIANIIKSGWENYGRTTTLNILKFAAWYMNPYQPRPKISNLPYGYAWKKTLEYVKKF